MQAWEGLVIFVGARVCRNETYVFTFHCVPLKEGITVFESPPWRLHALSISHSRGHLQINDRIKYETTNATRWELGPLTVISASHVRRLPHMHGSRPLPAGVWASRRLCGMRAPLCDFCCCFVGAISQLCPIDAGTHITHLLKVEVWHLHSRRRILSFT